MQMPIWNDLYNFEIISRLVLIVGEDMQHKKKCLSNKRYFAVCDTMEVLIKSPQKLCSGLLVMLIKF